MLAIVAVKCRSRPRTASWSLKAVFNGAGALDKACRPSRAIARQLVCCYFWRRAPIQGTANGSFVAFATYDSLCVIAACTSFSDTVVIARKAAFGTQQHMPTDGWTTICLVNIRATFHLRLHVLLPCLPNSVENAVKRHVHQACQQLLEVVQQMAHVHHENRYPTG